MEEIKPNPIVQISKKSRLVVFVVVLIYALASTTLRVWRALAGLESYPEALPQDLLASFTVVLIAMTIFVLAIPWFIRVGAATWLNNPRRGKPPKPGLILFVCYGMLLSPIVFGAFLHTLGLPITRAVLFNASGIVSLLAWGIYDLRKS